jgi:hypothetical protein
MSDVEKRFHESWLGMVQPVEGLVVSVPVLVDAQCMERLAPAMQSKLIELAPPRWSDDQPDKPDAKGDVGAPRGHTLRSLEALFTELLGYAPGAWVSGEALPRELSLYVPEGRQLIAPTMALPSEPSGSTGTSEGRSQRAWELLVWELPEGLELDANETVTGSWDYPPSAKFDRLLRHTRVPIGLLTNRRVLRLVYAPHGESSGHLTFDLDAMASVGGRPILDAFVMLLSATRTQVVEQSRSLSAILSESRKRQANVTNALAEQVFDALQILLRGFEAAAQRDGSTHLSVALSQDNDELYKGLLTVLLRLVFVLYAEDRGLLPVDHPLYARHLSALALFERLQRERGEWPDSMSRRFSAWGQLLALFRAIFLGVEHGQGADALRMPARRGELFDPHRFAFLEGWGPAGSAPIGEGPGRAAVRVPTVDDETVYRVLEKLLLLEGQRLSYRALDVEQIGSIYEGLMGYHVERVEHDSVCTKPLGVWTSVHELASKPAAQRAKWIKENLGVATALAERVSKAITAHTESSDEEKSGASGASIAEPLELIERKSKGDPGRSRARRGQLVLQPGSERRRTSSHYTPRSLSAPIVQRTLEPLLSVLGPERTAEQILALKVCDPAMGSGAFLVEACRFLADEVLAAWTRAGVLAAVSAEHGEPLVHARRLVAQRCLYGVDKNGAAVELAKLSLWLVTLARDLPFTFVDHALRHGDSLVGLDFEQIRSFHWKPGKQLELFTREVEAALDEAIVLRERILQLAASKRPADVKEKERLLWDAEDALGRVRLIGDLVVGAFFAAEKDKDREKERVRRLDLVRAWLQSGEAPSEELRELQRALRKRVPALHWAVEFPEVFYAQRPDPLDGMRVNGAACMDAFIGNPPFMGKDSIVATNGAVYPDWLRETFAGDTGVRGNCDLSAYFFRRAWSCAGRNGTIGFIATNTIGQGDTRLIGLDHLVSCGAAIYDASVDLPWPGEASVTVSVVHVSIGSTSSFTTTRLNGQPATAISSRLSASTVATEAVPLRSNEQLSNQGSVVLGAGFIVSPEEYTSLISSNPSNAECVFPYIGGQEINSDPAQQHSRYVINFGSRTLEECARWPDLLSIVETRVKPERDKQKGENSTSARRKRIWWQFDGIRADLYRSISPLARCIANSQVSKHLLFSFQPTNIVFAHTTNVFFFEAASQFAILQSRVHERWARYHGSSMKTDLRYTASECFDTFPFPRPDPRAVIEELEAIGEKLYTERAQYMVDENVGLTITYNRLKDPGCTEPRIVGLRERHEEMDRAVLRAYGWEDLVERVPPYCVSGEKDKRALEGWESEVIERLFGLNGQRAEEERVKGLGGKSAAKGKKKEPKAGINED